MKLSPLPFISLIAISAFFPVFAEPQRLPEPYPIHEKYDAKIGQSDALNMIKSGKFVILGVGLPSPCKYRLQQDLYKSHGILWETVGDYISEDFESYRNSFNRTMVDHITSVRGDCFFKQLDEKINDEERVQCKQTR